jgi:hypothetical protein
VTYKETVTLVRISDPGLIDLICADLQDRDDVLAERAGDDLVEIDIVGSYGEEGMRLATHLRVQAWAAGQRARGVDVRVEVVE